MLAEVEQVAPGNNTPTVTPVTVKTRTVRVIDCVPVAKKRIKTQSDIDSVVASIRQSLEDALKENDIITLD